MHIQNDSMKDVSLWNLRGKGKVTTEQGTYNGELSKFKVTTST
jgi:hypothetical protein